jgi:hypothetical protein
VAFVSFSFIGPEDPSKDPSEVGPYERGFSCKRSIAKTKNDEGELDDDLSGDLRGDLRVDLPDDPPRR